VAVHDLVIKDDDLVLATHGRSLWILDDLRPIREYQDKIGTEPLHLFTPDTATRWRYGSNNWGTRGAFSNPPHGATIYYSLKDEEKGDLKIEILDGQNHVVRTLSSTAPEPMGSDDNEDPDDFKNQALPRAAGVQRAVWDLRYEGARKIKNGRIDTGDPVSGPRVAPGTYTVKLSAGGKTLTAPLKVIADPRGDLTQADLEAQAAFAVRVRADISKLTDLVKRLRSVQQQLKARNAALEDEVESDIADRSGVGRGDQEGVRAGGQAAQSDRRSGLRHPRHARRREALFAPLPAADVGGRVERPADRGDDAGPRRAGKRARDARLRNEAVHL
jgi:hypothetical protein